MRDRTSAVEAMSQLRRTVRQTHVGLTVKLSLTWKKANIKDQATLPGRDSLQQTTDATTMVNAVSTDMYGHHSVISASSAQPTSTGLELGGSSSAPSGNSGIASSLGSPLQQSTDTQQRHSRVESGSSVSTSQPVVNHQTILQPSVSRLRTVPEGTFTNASRSVDVLPVSPTLYAEISHPGTNAAPWEVASDISFQRPSVGDRRPVVATLAPLSSSALLFIVGLMAVYTILRSVSAASLLLSVSALSLHAFGAAITAEPSGRQIERKDTPCVPKMMENFGRKMPKAPRLKLIEDTGRLFSTFSDMSLSRLERTELAARLLKI